MKLRTLIMAVMAWLAGCSTYDDEFTGRYVEVLNADREACFESRQCNAVMIDLFRFGDYSQAIVREFDRGLRNTVDNPFVEESRCYWTRADRFSESGHFNLKIRQQSTISAALRGNANDSGLNVEFLSDEESAPTLAVSLALETDKPVASCNSAGDYVLTAETQGVLPIGKDPIKNPVFLVVWLGLERYESPGGVVYLPTQGAPTWWRLPPSMVVDDGLGLSGYINGIQVPPPDPKFLSTSGETQFGLAHIVVVDDEEGDDDRFSWSLADEPIVASTLQDGTGSDSTWQLTEPTHGKALFFVNGNLNDLDPAIRERISNLDGYKWLDKHFYVVDYIADGEEIVEITLPQRLIGERPRMFTTDKFLDATRIELPRLFPYTTQ